MQIVVILSEAKDPLRSCAAIVSSKEFRPLFRVLQTEN
jgi:hypothetical protein